LYGQRTSGVAAVDDADFAAVMRTKALGPMRLLAAPGGRLAVVSSAMGSIGRAAASGGWLYRASKAAENMALHIAGLLAVIARA